MYTIPPKKMIIINILNILKKYSDMDHRLTQQQIVEYLKQDYFMDVDRKTVKRNLMNLLDLDCGIDYTEISRTDDKGNETSICTDWYMVREFDDSELRLLIDSLLFSKHVPREQCKALIDKLVNLSNMYFKNKVKHIYNLPENVPQNPQLFLTIEVIDDAISQGKKVGFMYNCYGPDKKLHPKRNMEYVVNPYQMVATNGRYYLICNYDRYDDLSYYRLDHISDIRIINEPAKPMKILKHKIDNLPKHMAEHIYMYSGDSVKVKFKAVNGIIDQVIDWFGLDVTITPVDDKTSNVEVLVNEEAFACWALQYGRHIEVLQPLNLRQKVMETISEIAGKYGIGVEQN